MRRLLIGTGATALTGVLAGVYVAWRVVDVIDARRWVFG